jgi:hypothetical protein
MPASWMLPNYGICHVTRRRSGNCLKRPQVVWRNFSCWLVSSGNQVEERAKLSVAGDGVDD